MSGTAVGTGTILERDINCPCHDLDTPSDDEHIDPTRLRTLIQKNCVNQQHQSGNLKLSISKISQLNLSHLSRYYSYSMLSNDSSESIVEDSLSSNCDSLGSKMVKSQSIHGLKDKATKAIEGEIKMAMTRDISSVPNFGELISPEIDNKYHGIALNSIPHNKLVSVAPVRKDSLDDSPGELLSHSIHGRLAFKEHVNSNQSTDTSISDNLMSFSCAESSVGSEANIHGDTHHGGGLGSFSNPNYIACDSERPSSLLSQDYWRTGALDLETVRHKQFAEMLRTPPDSGIGLGVEMERRNSQDIKTLEDFVNLENIKGAYRRQYQTAYPVVNVPDPLSCSPVVDANSSSSRNNSGTSRVTFGEASASRPSVRARNAGDRSGNPSGGGILTSARVNPFLRTDPTTELQGPEVMYIVGGKETGHVTGKRPLSVWKLDFPF